MMHGTDAKLAPMGTSAGHRIRWRSDRIRSPAQKIVAGVTLLVRHPPDLKYLGRQILAIVRCKLPAM